MKKKYKYLALLGVLPFLASAQIENNGATIIIEEGATLVVEGAIMNNVGGDIQNSGIIQVKGDFTNDGTLTSTALNADIQFLDDAAQIFDANGASVRKVTVNKGAMNVTLASPVTITDDLILTDGLLDIVGNNLTLGTEVTAIGSASSYVKADGAGKVVRSYAAENSFTFPVGGEEFSPITVAAAGTDSDATVGINIEEAALAMNPADADAFLDRNWTIEFADFADNTELTVTGTYKDPEDINGTETMIVGAVLDAADVFTYGTGDAVANEVVGTVNTGDMNSSALLTGTNAFRRQAVRVFLAGAYNGTNMTTTLNSSGLIPMTSPYDAAVSIGGAVSAVSGDIVDWVEIELRDAADEGAVLSTHSKFLRNDGLVLNLDGSTTATFRDAPATAYIAVKHRNHLGVMTMGAYTLGTAELDFTSVGTATYGADAQKTISGKTALWAGDVSGDKKLRYNPSFFPPIGSDVSQILVLLGNDVNGQLNGYSDGDVNMDGRVRYNPSFFPPIGSDVSQILSILGNDVNGQATEQLPN